MMLERFDYDKYKRLRDWYEVLVNRIANIRVFVFVVMLVSFIVKYYYYEAIFNIIFFVSLGSFIIMIIIYNKYFKIYDYYAKYVLILDSYIDRESGKWKEFEDDGSDFLDDKTYFLSDLDIAGDCSLFQYLSICNTLGGRENLMNKLTNLDFDKNNLIEAQKAIMELSSDVNFCVIFQMMMSFYKNKKVNLSNEIKKNRRIDCGIDFWIWGIFSFICILFGVLGLLKIIPVLYFYGIFLFNIVISLVYSYIFREDFFNLNRLVNNYSRLYDVFDFVGNYSFSSVKMKKISKNMRSSLEDVKRIKRLDGINSLRSNFISSFLLNGLCCFNLFVRVKYASCLECSLNGLENGVLDIEELESMISLATIGIVREDKCMPVIADKVSLSFDDIKHPLIDKGVCVGNDFNVKHGVNIITGSNMGGKTTFLRTVGINLILMQAGTYVCATRLEASYFKIFTSMRVMDNVSKGISTFYGELLRIKEMVDYNGNGNMLVLVDEIFKGTNYEDRMYGAKEVVKSLNNKSTIALITTHDFELSESDGVSNYHVKEEYEGDRIVFDYKIRKGRCTSTNAKYLMEKLDIISKKC